MSNNLKHMISADVERANENRNLLGLLKKTASNIAIRYNYKLESEEQKNLLVAKTIEQFSESKLGKKPEALETAKLLLASKDNQSVLISEASSYRAHSFASGMVVKKAAEASVIRSNNLLLEMTMASREPNMLMKNAMVSYAVAWGERNSLDVKMLDTPKGQQQFKEEHRRMMDPYLEVKALEILDVKGSPGGEITSSQLQGMKGQLYRYYEKQASTSELVEAAKVQVANMGKDQSEKKSVEINSSKLEKMLDSIREAMFGNGTREEYNKSIVRQTSIAKVMSNNKEQSPAYAI